MSHVAKFSFSPAPGPFGQIARGVLPLPKDFTDVDRLAFRRPDGTLLPTQREVTLRRADETPQSVELITFGKGLPAELDVVVADAPRVAPVLPLHPAINWMLQQDFWVQLTDAFGNRYRSDLMMDLADTGEENQFQKLGCAEVVLETSGTLVPAPDQPEPSRSLENAGGFVAMVHAWPNQPGIVVDMYWHTGFGPESTKCPSPLDFEDLRLYLPIGVGAATTRPTHHAGGIETDEYGNRYFNLIRALQGPNEVHRIYNSKLKLFRFVIVPEGFESFAAALSVLNGEGVFVDGTNEGGDRFWSAHNPETPITTEGFALPTLDHVPTLASQVAERVVDHNQRRVTGQPWDWHLGINGQSIGAFGYLHPKGAGYGGATGGTDIDHQEFPAELIAAVPGAGEYIRSRMECIMDRHAGFLIGETGKPWDINAYMETDGRLFNFAVTPSPVYDGIMYRHWVSYSQDPFGMRAEFQHVNPDKTCPYAHIIKAYGAIDIQHWARIKQEAKALTQFWNDPMAKRLLQDLATQVRADIFDVGTGTYTAALGHLLKNSQDNPEMGTYMGREHGWGAECIGVAYASGTAKVRDSFRNWLTSYLETCKNGQVRSGILCVFKYSKELSTNGFNNDYAPCLSYQEAILEWGILTAARAVYGEGSSEYETYLRVAYDSARALYDLGRVPGANGPYYKFAVGPLDATSPEEYFTTQEQVQAAPKTGVSTFQYPISIATALFAGRQLGIEDPASDMVSQYCWGQDPMETLEGMQLSNIENIAPLLAELQLRQTTA